MKSGWQKIPILAELEDEVLPDDGIWDDDDEEEERKQTDGSIFPQAVKKQKELLKK